MSGIDTIYTLVQDGLKRPDLQQRVWRRIHRSILKHHQIDQWKRDRFDQIYNFSPPNSAAAYNTVQAGINGLFMNWFGNVQFGNNVQAIDLTTLVRYRKMSYIRKWMTQDSYGNPIQDPTTGQVGSLQGGDLREVNSDSLFDGYGYDKFNVYYRVGDEIQIRSDTPLTQCFLGYFQNPVVNLGCSTEEEFQTYNSWIADNYPGLIISDSLKQLFISIGKPEIEAKGTAMEYAEELAAFTASEVTVSTRGE